MTTTTTERIKIFYSKPLEDRGLEELEFEFGAWMLEKKGAIEVISRQAMLGERMSTGAYMTIVVFYRE